MTTRCSIFAVDKIDFDVAQIAIYNEAPSLSEMIDAVVAMERRYGIQREDVRVVGEAPHSVVLDLIRRVEKSDKAAMFCEILEPLASRAIAVLTTVGIVKYVVAIDPWPPNHAF